MKKLLFIALMFSFLVGNAQQKRQQYVPNSTMELVQFYTDNHPGYPILIDPYVNDIRKTDAHPGSDLIDLNRYESRKTDNHPGSDLIYLNRNTIRKTDYHPDNPIFIDLNRYSGRKTN